MVHLSKITFMALIAAAISCNGGNSELSTQFKSKQLSTPGLNSQQGSDTQLSLNMLSILSGKQDSVSAELNSVAPGKKSSLKSRLLILTDSFGTEVNLLAESIQNNATAQVTLWPDPDYTFLSTQHSLENYDCIVHLNSDVHSTLPAQTRTDLQQFVARGGGYISTQANFYETSLGLIDDMREIQLVVPNSSNHFSSCIDCPLTYHTQDTKNGHPLMAGIPANFTFAADGYAGSDLAQFTDAPVEVITRDSSGWPGVATRQFQNGRVVNFSFIPNIENSSRQTLHDLNIQRLYQNAVNWSCPKTAETLQVAIDIKPNSDLNPIQLKARGVIPVLVFGSAEFDVSQIDTTTVRFGSGQSSPLHADGHFDDHNGDGYQDWLAHFPTQKSVTDATATELELSGKTLGGIDFRGADQVKIIHSSDRQKPKHQKATKKLSKGSLLQLN